MTYIINFMKHKEIGDINKCLFYFYVDILSRQLSCFHILDEVCEVNP